MENQDVYLIKGSKGEDKCPAGKLAIYTHVNFNAGSTAGDILIVSPDISLDRSQLESYGFPLGKGNGVSSIVNKMEQDATLVSGLYLDGTFMTVKAGKNITSLADYTLGSGTWNDAVNSVVSAPVENVNVTLSIESAITLQEEESYYALLLLKNDSNDAISGANVTATSSEAGIFSVGAFTQTVDIPAKGTQTVRIPLLGESTGAATLTCVLTMPFGIINEGNNMSYTSVSVTEPRKLVVKQSFVGKWQDTWPSTDYVYSYRLLLCSEETMVKEWELSFILPEGAKISPEWLASEGSWVKLNVEKSVNGNIVLDSRDDHIIKPEMDMALSMQIVYPNQSTDYETLKNLRLVQLA